MGSLNSMVTNCCTSTNDEKAPRNTDMDYKNNGNDINNRNDVYTDNNNNASNKTRRAQNRVTSLTSKKNYNINSDNSKYIKKSNDSDIEYDVDGHTIITKKNGITVNKYGHTSYNNKTQTDNEILDDMLIT